MYIRHADASHIVPSVVGTSVQIPRHLVLRPINAVKDENYVRAPIVTVFFVSPFNPRSLSHCL